MSKIIWTLHNAVHYAEGFGEDASKKEEIEAWAYLIKTNIVWKLQGWFGTTANKLIQQGIIDKNGSINWHKLKEIEVKK